MNKQSRIDALAVKGGYTICAASAVMAVVIALLGLESRMSVGILAGPSTSSIFLVAVVLLGVAAVASGRISFRYRQTGDAWGIRLLGKVGLILGLPIALFLLPAISSGEIFFGIILASPVIAVIVGAMLCLRAQPST